MRALALACASDVLLVSFGAGGGGGPGPADKSWTEVNDPVMGGKSTGTFTTGSTTGDHAIFGGEVVDVPFLHAPGFIKAEGTGDFADASSCSGVELKLAGTSGYTGFRFSFGSAHAKGGNFAYGYKATLPPLSGRMQVVSLPFTSFTDRWDDATGEPITTCAQDASFCPDAATLANMKTVSFWAEGAAGKVLVDLYAITATGCKAQETVSVVAEAACPPPNFQPAAGFDLDAYVAQPWYIQQEAVTTYLPASHNRCVSATYKKAKSFWGYEVSVHNVAYDVAAPHKIHEANICAKIEDAATGKLKVAPCFLPAAAAGPYWVLHFDDTKGYAVISGGPPMEASNGKCKNSAGTNGSGLWVFTRGQARDEALVAEARGKLAELGFDLAVLSDVDQTDCPPIPGQTTQLV